MSDLFDGRNGYETRYERATADSDRRVMLARREARIDTALAHGLERLSKAVSVKVKGKGRLFGLPLAQALYEAQGMHPTRTVDTMLGPVSVSTLNAVPERDRAWLLCLRGAMYVRHGELRADPREARRLIAIHQGKRAA